MIALILVVSQAFAADVLLSGGLSATPTAADLFTPSWRLGVDAGRVTPWFTVSYASFETEVARQSTSGFALLPRIGARFDLAERTAGRPITFVGITATTRLFGLAVEEEDPLDLDESKPLLPLGGGLSLGLDAPVTEALSLSAEIGGEAYHLGYTDRGYTTRIITVNTVAAVYVNFWL